MTISTNDLGLPEKQGARIRRYLYYGRKNRKGKKTPQWLAGVLGLHISTTNRKLLDEARTDGKRGAKSGWRRQEVQITAEALGVPFEELYVPRIEMNRASMRNTRPVTIKHILKDDLLLQKFFQSVMDSQTRDHVAGLLIEIKNYLADNHKAISRRVENKREKESRRIVLLYVLKRICKQNRNLTVRQLISCYKLNKNYGHYQGAFDELWREFWDDKENRKRAIQSVKKSKKSGKNFPRA